MKLDRLRNEPGTLADFYQEALEHLGAVCERTWFDRLGLIAEGQAARLWNPDGSLTEVELNFTAPGSSTPRNAERDVFPGCPLTFRLAEAFLSPNLVLERAVLEEGSHGDLAAVDVLEKLWRNQWPGERSWRMTSAATRSRQFSLLALVRGEIQAIEQHWSVHRLAVSLPGGERDESLASALEFVELTDGTGDSVDWPQLDPGQLRQHVLTAMTSDLQDTVSSIRTRQEAYLRRELDRIDNYFENYATELKERATRTRSDESRLKADERLAAARAEHERRRQDQVQRHEIRIVPHIDALILIAELAWNVPIAGTGRGETVMEVARYVPRTRRWFRG
jgi:hypothetical protein